MSTSGDHIAVSALETFKRLPAKSIKCLPAIQIPTANGAVLHDCHAETIAIRAFNHFLLQECLKFASLPGYSCRFIRRRKLEEMSEENGFQPFTFQEDIKIHMYCSEAPCGDASMELVMNAQKDATPWPVAERQETSSPLKGRGSFSELGIVRRKPGSSSSLPHILVASDTMTARADSPLTLSKSCSDKIALKQCTALLSSLTSLFINPENAYLETLVLPSSRFNKTAGDRAFGPNGRMKSISGRKWRCGYSFHPFQIQTTAHEFEYSCHNVSNSSKSLRTSKTSAVYNPSLEETLINGRLQGRKLGDPKGASQISNIRMVEVVMQVLTKMEPPAVYDGFKTYRQLKSAAFFKERRQVKHDVTDNALKGWICNEGADFRLSL
ncbi:MAG: hypothetical protein Q9190_002318 [Brigantiaea leucoxantha]